ncbi:Na+/H+ antiporter NhaA [Geobacter sp. AOG2]|uniref:Na+/H+ antiporter NhaA n=1 Tax=Geobacter sp. AOG2 TaxID=1566347 RepID=UPI001CC79292|nr:Na+/H+ antiporter NhaA [Geobacter sp. AOG2]GFE62819.1 Na(+)/H(+) antiporter NhaA [Geobacter sp. AOG2]
MKIKLTKLFIEFFNNEKTSGIILILCTITSIGIANSPFGQDYLDFWHTKIALGVGDTFILKYSLEHWINDGLMSIFFLLIGLEIEREIYIGELSRPKNASLPIIAAIGGMIMPALLHFLFNSGTATQAGAGIPMATDIAFAIGVLALLGDRVPVSLKIFLTALAIIDDLGAILVIALFYQSDFSLPYFILSLGVYAGLLALNRFGVNRLSAYLIPGVVMWYFMLQSGVHATIAGVLLAFAIPFRNGDEKSPSYQLQHFMHKPVAFLIMPVFALANTGIALTGNWVPQLASPNSLGVFAGLVAGKPLGITLFSLLAVKWGISRLPEDVRWNHIVGAGFLSGIGFTMSIFITLLAFDTPEIVQNSKTSILLSSLVAGTIGFLILRGKPVGKHT